MGKIYRSRNELTEENKALQRQIAELKEQLEATQNDAGTGTNYTGEQYQSLFEQAADSILIVDSESMEIIAANTHAVMRLGYDKSELIGKKLLDIEVGKPAEPEQSDVYAWESTLSGMFMYESVYRKKDGTLFPVEVRSAVIVIDGREVIQDVVRDITRRKLVEQQKREIYLERERVNLLSKFIEQTSHHFRTPLSIINTKSFLMSRTKDATKRATVAENIKDEVAKITNLVDTLTTLSTIANMPETDRDAIEITAFMRHFLDVACHTVNEQQIAIEYNESVSSCVVQGDADYLMIAFQHLFDNALKSIQQDGTITVHISATDRIATISFHDTGSGIDPEHLPHIFETFYRADAVGTTSGLGLGLAIVKMIVHMHEGRIEVHSAAGEGSLFKIHLPRAGA